MAPKIMRSELPLKDLDPQVISGPWDFMEICKN
jgi:hypothetical protein